MTEIFLHTSGSLVMHLYGRKKILILLLCWFILIYLLSVFCCCIVIVVFIANESWFSPIINYFFYYSLFIYHLLLLCLFLFYYFPTCSYSFPTSSLPHAWFPRLVSSSRCLSVLLIQFHEQFMCLRWNTEVEFVFTWVFFVSIVRERERVRKKSRKDI